MNKLANKIWIAPATAILLPLVFLLLMVAPGIGSRVASIVQNAYEIMFWAAPVVGVTTLLVVSFCRVFGSIDRKSPDVKRAVRLGGLALFSPVWLLALQILLSGFAR